MRKAILPIALLGLFSACQSERVPPVADGMYSPSVNDQVIAASIADDPKGAQGQQVFYNPKTKQYYRLPAGTLAMANTAGQSPVLLRKRTGNFQDTLKNSQSGIWVSQAGSKGRVTFSRDISDHLAIARAVNTCKGKKLSASTGAILLLPDSRKQMDFICQ